MINYLKKNYKFLIFIAVVTVSFYFIFFRSYDSEGNETGHETNVFVVPEQEKKEKTKEELYKERFAVNAEKEVDIGKIIQEQEKSKNMEDGLHEQINEPVASAIQDANNPVIPQSVSSPIGNSTSQKQPRQVQKKAQSRNEDRETKVDDPAPSASTQPVAPSPDPIVATSQAPQEPPQSQGKTIYRNQPQNKGNSFKASIFGDQIITQTGLIKVRVTEKTQLGELSLERNDILEANVNMSGGIINITIPGVIKNGLYYELNASGIAESGRQITYNESELRKASKDASGSVAASAAQEITGSSTLGNAVGSVISRTVSSSSSTTNVTLQDGFKIIFFTK